MFDGWTKWVGGKSSLATGTVYLGVELDETDNQNNFSSNNSVNSNGSNNTSKIDLKVESKNDSNTDSKNEPEYIPAGVDETINPGIPRSYIIGLSGIESGPKKRTTCLGIVIRKISEQNIFSYLWVTDAIKKKKLLEDATKLLRTNSSPNGSRAPSVTESVNSNDMNTNVNTAVNTARTSNEPINNQITTNYSNNNNNDVPSTGRTSSRPNSSRSMMTMSRPASTSVKQRQLPPSSTKSLLQATPDHINQSFNNHNNNNNNQNSQNSHPFFGENYHSKNNLSRAPSGNESPEGIASMSHRLPRLTTSSSYNQSLPILDRFINDMHRKLIDDDNISQASTAMNALDDGKYYDGSDEGMY